MARGIDFSQITEFEWDAGNKEKNSLKHNVENTECEEVFLNNPVLRFDRTHSQEEDRYLAYGLTNNGRLLVIAFTLRGKEKERIRVISARNHDKKERAYYHLHKKEVDQV